MNQRYVKAQFASILGIVANLLLAIIKGIAGVFTNSKALIADAFHSASDVVSSFAVLIGIRAARKPPDPEHPYGHGKAENIATLIVSILLIIVGFEILLDAIQSIWQHNTQDTSINALYVVIFSIIVKEALFQYKYRLGHKINSPAIIADAWHHRSDSLSSVIALAGIGISIAGSHYGIPALQYFDPVAGSLIAVLVMWMGFKLGQEAVNVTLETVLDEEETKNFEQSTLTVEGVKRIDTLNARTHGSYVIIDVKISVDPEITVDEGHSIAANLKEQLMDEHEEVQDVYVHVNPYH
ncbi:cation diffusion facilitator family transporter [Tenuibacillus multivorans]|uniref:Cation diffusion facilitator family transporter n=1 Tax=Tenuibacillus multivorans TaxID=237069 RepID=A0A1H0B3M3_9BACI|nr:cation diffusion facilitator family transporter [Tenuibacillus multivorans]GEL77543.1 cation transporter [Tenuibacillus multivorans]SDN40248.1 cation diffusion facilitator family transporter [Tenuibacillus multivorans]